jgi:hypothetical protein
MEAFTIMSRLLPPSLLMLILKKALLSTG